MRGSALGQDGVDGLSVSTRRVVFPGLTPSTAQLPPRRTVFSCLNEARLAVSGIEDDIDTPTAGRPRYFGSDIVALIIKDVMRARLSG